MGRGVDEEEVSESVVLLVAVDVMDLVSVGNRTVFRLPDDDVSESMSASDLASEVSLAGDVVAVGSFRLRSGLCHAPSLSHSPRSR
jgi:hypothetical protein